MPRAATEIAQVDAPLARVLDDPLRERDRLVDQLRAAGVAHAHLREDRTLGSRGDYRFGDSLDEYPRSSPTAALPASEWLERVDLVRADVLSEAEKHHGRSAVGHAWILFAQGRNLGRMTQVAELEEGPVEREAGLVETNRVGWHLLQFMRDSLTSLEEQATRIAAGQIAGLIALWTQLHTFEAGPPRSLAWAAWAVLLFAIVRLAPLVTPRRLARFWKGLPVKGALTSGDCIDCDAEARLIVELTEATERQMNRIRSGLNVSIALGCLALGFAALGYVIEKI
jgi:hypothetical protein